MTEISEIIGVLGFPMAVSVWLLWERHTKNAKQLKLLLRIARALDLLSEQERKQYEQ